MAIASLVLGIISIVFSVIGLNFFGILIGIVGIILGVSARKNTPSGMATAGFVLSIIGTVLCSLVFIACAACIGAAATLV